MNSKIFKSFFKSYAENVDNADQLFFWKLSDELIEDVLIKNLSKRLSRTYKILDAGGGTGRWIVKIKKKYECTFVLYDLSKEMLKKAKENFNSIDLIDRVKIYQGNLENMNKIKDESIDYLISIYNPISFVSHPDKVLKEFHRIISKKGRVIIMAQNIYNGICSKMNNPLSSVQELKELEQKNIIKWNPYTPTLSLFSKESLQSLLEENGFRIIKSYGIPIFLQPGPEDFDSANRLKSKISHKLEKDLDFYKEVKRIESKYNSFEELVNRGMNILTVAEKS